jgi:hypothetical protein
MGYSSLDLVRKFKVGFGDRKLGLNLVDAYAMVHERKEANGFGCLEQLFEDLRLAYIEV